jgi:hypothetical protein
VISQCKDKIYIHVYFYNTRISFSLGPAKVLCDNMSVVYNTTAPESVLKKKSNTIAYHFVRENVALKVIKIAYEPSESNLADILTKVQTGPVRQAIIRSILW